MTKQDLKTGMVVKLRDGSVFLVVTETNCLINGQEYLRFTSFNDDLTSHYDENWDIVYVYNTVPSMLEVLLQHPVNIVWERKKPKELTVAEIEKLIGYPVKIVKE